MIMHGDLQGVNLIRHLAGLEPSHGQNAEFVSR